MKTKHLFFAAALAASFTACTSEELVEVQQQGVATVERPTVENVQLNFIGEGVESRLLFNGEYAWEATDTIGALLMDTPWNLSADEWINQYRLQNYVNTSYPFTYSTEDKTWSCPGKMLEGNYFFAYPWSSYDGGRQMKHSLLTQSQKGIAGNVVAEALAENQLFIGYSQIKKGAAFDVLTDVEMTSVLGAVQFRIKNAGDKTYHINKVVLSSTNGYVWSELTFDPTKADYAGETLEDNTTAGADFCYAPWSNAHYFNYANYVGDEEAVGVYDITEANAKYYNKANALRKVVNKATGARGVAYLNVEGTEAERAVAPGATAYALIMVNPLTDAQADDVKITLYTDEGQIEFVKTLGAQYKLDNTMVADVRPGVSNTVNLEFVDNQVKSPSAFSVYTEEDLAQYIDWMSTSPAGTSATINLYADVELNADMFNKMKGNTKVTWTFVDQQAAGSVLTLAEDVPASALDYTGITYDYEVDLKVLGTVDVTAATKTRLANKTLDIAEGGKLNIKVAIDGSKVVLPTIYNEGTVEISAIQIAATAPAITNSAKGTVNVVAGADVKSVVKNYGKLNNNGYMESVTNGNSDAEDEAVINLGANAVLKGLANDTDAEVIAAAGSSVAGTNNGLVSCADNTVKINLTNGTYGKVALEVTGAIAKDAYKDLKYNTLKIKGQTTFADIQTGIAHIITTDGSELKLAEAAATYTLSLTSLEINGATTITTVLTGEKTNSIKTSKMTIKEGATLTNNGTFVVASETATDWVNEGLVINNQNATLAKGVTSANRVGNWKYNSFAEYTYTPAYDPKEAEGHRVVFSTNLKDAITEAKKAGANKNNDNLDTNDFIEYLEIHGTLDMADEFKSSSTATKNDVANFDYAADAFAETVELYEGASIINLLNDESVAMGKLVVKGHATIKGTKNMPMLKVEELVVEPAAVLNIEGGYLEIDVTAQLGMGCQYIDLTTGAINGEIVAKNAEGTYLYWNVKTEKWQENTAGSENVSLTGKVATAADLKDAIASTYLPEIELTENLSFNENAILDLNGKTLNIADEKQIKVTKGDFTLKNGKVVSNGHAIAVESSTNPASITIATDATVESTGKSCIWVPNGLSAAVKVNIAGAVKTSSTTHAAVQTNGLLTNDLEINVTGGSITNDKDIAIYAPYAKKMTISGGTITGVHSAVEFRQGELIISGGKLISTAETEKYTWNGNGSCITGAALAIAPYFSDKAVKVTITGGEFEGVRGIICGTQHADNYTTLSIEGGKFTASTAQGTSALKNYENVDLSGVVKAGSFNKLKDSEIDSGSKKKTENGVIVVSVNPAP